VTCTPFAHLSASANPTGPGRAELGVRTPGRPRMDLLKVAEQVGLGEGADVIEWCTACRRAYWYECYGAGAGLIVMEQRCSFPAFCAESKQVLSSPSVARTIV